MTKICSYCLNSPRLSTPPGVIPGDDHTKFDCPVCQENLVLDESQKENIDEEEFPEDEFDEQDLIDLDEEDFFDDEEDEEELEDEDYDQF